MQHTIPLNLWSEKIGPQIQGMAKAVDSCVHCGFCLPVCPTYNVLGEEMDSPRGRISLMKSALEGALTLEDTLPYIDRCLGCLACVPACPSGVKYGELMTPFRAYARSQVDGGLMHRVQHSLLKNTLPDPARFRTAAQLGRMARPMSGMLPSHLRGLLDMLPENLPPPRPLPDFVPAEGVRRARVAFLAGCVQQVLAPSINWATLRVLAKNGVEVVIPTGQVCCGAILIHSGEMGEARKLARTNISLFPDDVDAILTNAAGCGSGMKEYPMLFAGEEDELLAQDFSTRVQDVSQFLAGLGLVSPPGLAQPLKAAYHDACHLAHAQGITEAPRRLLGEIPNLALAEIPDGGLCCGSAGTYNLEQPEIARILGRNKAKNILATGGQAVIAGNIGCMVQIQKHLQASGQALPVYHTFEILDLAYNA